MELNEFQREIIFRATHEYRHRHVDNNPRDLTPSLFETKTLLAALRDRNRLNEALALTATKVLEEAADETAALDQARLYIGLKEVIDKEMARFLKEAERTS
jgi:hypothetical protein